jgi:opine dehydrogenase
MLKPLPSICARCAQGSAARAGFIVKLAVIGAGNGGVATAVELTLAGHDVALYGRSAATIAPFVQDGIRYTGVLGEGVVRPALLSSRIAEVINGAEAAIICLPTFAHVEVARALHAAGWGAMRPVLLNPGHTGGAFEFDTAYRAAAGNAPPIVEFATLAYVVRKPVQDTVNITGRAKSLRAAAMPGAGEALRLASALFPGVYDSGDVTSCDLSNINMVVHPPGAILGAAWVEATRGDFTFYVQGLTPGVIQVMSALDRERIAVGKAFGHELPNVIDEMKAVGTVPADADSRDYAAIASGEANRRIKAPDSLSHRYYMEDFSHGLVPFLAYAHVAKVEVPIASALTKLGLTASAGRGAMVSRTATTMGFEGWSLEQLLQRARG